MLSILSGGVWIRVLSFLCKFNSFNFIKMKKSNAAPQNHDFVLCYWKIRVCLLICLYKMWYFSLFLRGRFKPISIFAFFDFDVSLYLHFSPKTPQWGLKMRMLSFDLKFKIFSLFSFWGNSQNPENFFFEKKFFWNVAEVAILNIFCFFWS